MDRRDCKKKFLADSPLSRPSSGLRSANWAEHFLRKSSDRDQSIGDRLEAGAVVCVVSNVEVVVAVVEEEEAVHVAVSVSGQDAGGGKGKVAIAVAEGGGCERGVAVGRGGGREDVITDGGPAADGGGSSEGGTVVASGGGGSDGITTGCVEGVNGDERATPGFVYENGSGAWL